MSHITLTSQELITLNWWLLIEQLWSVAEDSPHTEIDDFNVIYVPQVDYDHHAKTCAILTDSDSVHTEQQHSNTVVVVMFLILIWYTSW